MPTARVHCVHDSESSSSPDETYDDASVDFEFVNSVVYQHINPGIGQTTHSHDTQIRCNFKIYYSLILDHGNLVGDGNVNAQHISSGSAADGDVLTADGSGGAAFEAPTGGGGGGGGTDDQTAAEVTVDTTNFSRNLTSTDDHRSRGRWRPSTASRNTKGHGSRRLGQQGVIVTRSGIAYISLVNANTQIPTPASTQWSGLPEGFTYRGEAPVAATNYNYGHFTFDPGTDNVYVFASTISASVARADISTHANFIPLVNVLSDAEAVDDTSHVYGSVSGSQIADAIAAHGSGGGGAITQATETALGGVRGATAGQAIATSGTTILGWSNNRVRQLVSSALPAMTQADIDNATTGRKSVTGALIADNVGGGGGGGGTSVAVDATLSSASSLEPAR